MVYTKPVKVFLTLFLFTVLFKSALTKISSTVYLEYREEQEVGTFVGNIAVESGMTSTLSQEEFLNLQFVIADSKYFQIEEKSGAMSTKQVIDRETVCPRLSECSVEVEVVVYKTDVFDLFKYLTAVINITDINDNSPKFPSESVVLSIPESNAVDDLLTTSGAIDLDTGTENSVKQYSFLDPTNTFSLTIRKNPDGSSYLGIIIKEVLDREARDFFQVTVVATDGGYPQRSGSVVINITVSDINDNVPEFFKSSYNESFYENIAYRVPIMKVEARDKDIGRNAEISYQFSSRVSSQIRQKFLIDEHTGEILAQSQIDYEKDKLFQFHVEAVDHGTSQLSSRVGVTLHVMDKNDNAPQININLPPKGTEISENEGVGKFVAHVSVLDLDEGANAEVSCNMDDNHFSMEKFYEYSSNMYKVVLAKSLDYEQEIAHRVSITCTDNGIPSLSNSTTFVVNVLDENDNRPAFSEDTYYPKVIENLVGEIEILNVTAHDWDSGEFGRISYSIEDKYNGLFTIDPEKGSLKVVRPLDREDISRYEFHVIARDHGPERLSSSSLVIVTVEDENDEPPRFPKPVYFGDVLENQPSGTSVGNVTAVDLDSPANAKFSYSILRQGPDYSNFSINANTGVIKSKSTFDRETKDQYHFNIRVTDPYNPQFFSTCNFTVRVLDDNDHDPVIQGSSEENTTVIIQYSAPVGSVITNIVAYDRDDASSHNSELRYFIQKGDPNQLFNLNKYTGGLALARIIKAKDIKTYNLIIKVQDGGSPPRYDTKQIYIKINGTIPADASSGGLSDNILIVIILVGVTIVLALAILATICLIKKIDRERKQNKAKQKNSEENMYQLKQPDVFTNMSTTVGEDSNSNNLSKKEKKEVSFSLDEETDSHNTSAGSGQPLTSFKGGTDRTDGHPSRRVHGTTSKPQGNGGMNIPVNIDKQSNLRRSPQDEECHLIEILKKSADDALSESSGDPSDSGRGGSEDDSSHRGSGVDPEHSNTSSLYPQVLYRGHSSSSDGKNKHLHPPKTSRQTSLPGNKGKQTRHSPNTYLSQRDSLSSDGGSDFSGSRTSQSRSGSDRSFPGNHNRPFPGNPRHPNRPASQMLPFRSHGQYKSRDLLTQDSPNRLASPLYHNNNNNDSALMRSFHGHPSNSFQVAPPLTSVSMERLAHLNSSERPYQYSDRSYNPSNRWNAHTILPEEDDRTTTSGSYTINPEELRQEIDELILHDSIV